MSKPFTSLEDALALCLDDLAQGASLEQCLARFPEHAAELAPLLRVATRAQAQTLPALSLGGRVRGRERMQAALTRPIVGSGRPRALFGGLAAAVIFLSLAAGVWLSWPGRDNHGENGHAAQPTLPSPAATTTPSAIPTITPAAESSSTPTLSPSPTSAGMPATATATATASPTFSPTPTSLPTASATIHVAASPTQGLAETPQSRETAAPAETRETDGPGETRETDEPAEMHETDEPTEMHETDEPTETPEKPTPATATSRPEATVTHSEPPSATPAQPAESPEPEPTPGQTPEPASTPHADDRSSWDAMRMLPG